MPVTNLADLQDTLQLSDLELGRLVGCDLETVVAWRDAAVPAADRDRCEAILRSVDALGGRVQAGLLAEVVRRPNQALGGSTMLEALRTDPQHALDAIGQTFDWSSTA